MITATLFKTEQDDFSGFHLKGHAGYAEYGFDIVCAAVSALALNTVNSVEAFSDEAFTVEESDGELKFFLSTCKSLESQLFLKSFALALENIHKEYGSKYIRIQFRIKEV
jgi:uncharacterized protein YsxB (DUF464 family)